MTNNNVKALKSGVWYTASSFLLRSIGFITTPIFTRLLTKAEFGAFNNYISWLHIITIFVTFDLEATLISARFDFSEKLDEYILSLLGLSTLSAAIWLVISNVFIGPISQFLALEPLYVNALLVYLVFLPPIRMFQARERYRYEYKIMVATSLVLAIGMALLSVLLVLNMSNRLTGRIFGSVIPVVLMGFFFFVHFFRKGRKIDFRYWKYALPICLPFIPHLLSMTLLHSTDRVMITRWCGPEKTALYSLAYSCGAIVTILLTSVNRAYGPWLGEKVTENKLAEVRKFSKIYISGFVFVAIGIMLVSPEILLILGGERYREAMYVMTPVSMGCVCQFLYTMFVNLEQLKKKTIGMAVASAIAAGVNFLLNWLFIPRIGYLAAAYTTLASYFVLLSMHMFLVYRLKLNNAYSYGFVMMTVLLGLVCMVLITLSFGHNILRGGIFVAYVGVFACLIVKFRDRLSAVLARKRRARGAQA